MRTKHRLIELGKSLVIVCLSVSAVFLFLQSTGTQLSFFSEETGDESHQFTATSVGNMTVSPGVLGVQFGEIRYFAQGREIASVFEEKLGSFLRDALTEMATQNSFYSISQENWEESLVSYPWIYYDFLGEMPLYLFELALVGETNLPDTMVRRFLITMEGEETFALSFADDDGNYYKVNLSASAMGRFEEVLGTFSHTGGLFAFETSDYAGLSNTVIFPEESQIVESASQGISLAFSDALEEEMLTILGFNPKALVEYETSDGVGIREGDDSLRISLDGSLHFSTSEETPTRYVIGSTNLGDEILYCYSLFESLWTLQNSEGSIYLSDYFEGENGEITLQFSYLLAGTRVKNMPQDYAGQFVIKGGSIASFDMYIRAYDLGDTAAIVLPLTQAFAMTSSLDLSNKELFFAYVDVGEGGDLTVQWGVKGQ